MEKINIQSTLNNNYLEKQIDDEYINCVLKDDLPKQRNLFEIMDKFAKQCIRKTINVYPYAKPYDDELYSCSLELMGLCLKNYKPGNNNFVHYFHKTISLGIASEALKLTNRTKKTYYLTENKPENNEIQYGVEDEKIKGNIAYSDSAHQIAEYSQKNFDKEARKILQDKLRGATIKELANELKVKDKHVYYVFGKIKNRLNKLSVKNKITGKE